MGNEFHNRHLEDFPSPDNTNAPQPLIYTQADLDQARKEAREAAFEDAIVAVARLPVQGTMNYRRGHEEGIGDAIRVLKAANIEEGGGDG